MHNPIVRTPQSADASKDQDTLFADNVAYLDKQVGEIVGALDRLGLRERTIIVFASDNGTAKYGIEHAFIRGRHIYGMKETMFEGGSRVPLIVNWKGTVAAGRTSDNLIDFTDVLPTFAELAGAPLPSQPAPWTGAASHRRSGASAALRGSGCMCSTIRLTNGMRSNTAGS